MPSSKPIPGVNDLQTKFPDIAEESYGWDPTTVTAGTGQKKEWQCNKGHIYSSTVANRTGLGNGCPVCSGHKILKGFNDLQTKYPEIAAEAYGWDATGFSARSNKKMPWLCNNGHEWEAVIANRTRERGGQCPYCSGKRPILGETDLQTKYPEVAAEADGWKATTVTCKSHKKLTWKCSLGHKWIARVADRTPPESTACPYCSGRLPIIGKTDLLTLRPDIAAQSDGWNPAEVTIACNDKKSWICSLDHRWQAPVYSRTQNKSGCPVCAGKVVLSGFNDLATLFPDLAIEAFGWDPLQVTCGSSRVHDWKCNLGHIYSARVSERTPPQSTKCPYCCGQRVLVGYNDLNTIFPGIAKEAMGWDPSTVTAGSKKKMQWRCNLGHTYTSDVKSRTPPLLNGCPYCSGHRIWVGFNDLKTTHPDLARETKGWDPESVSSGSGRNVDWICPKGHTWNATIGSRAAGNGCPFCAEYGFNRNRDAWIYLMERPGEQQIGITNNPKTRLATHKSNGWNLLQIVGPVYGDTAFKIEQRIKVWLKKEIGTLPGTTENWSTSTMEVSSLTELKSRCMIVTNLF